MASSILENTKKNASFYNTNFPDNLDDVREHGLMQDIDADVVAQYKIYENQIASGQSQAAYDTAYKLVNGKRLADALFNADKYNWLRDSILAMQEFFLERFDSYIAQKTQEVVKTSTDENGSTSDATAYTVDKVNELLFGEIYVPLLASNWTQDKLTKVYKQDVSVPEVKASRQYVRHPLLTKQYDINSLSFINTTFTADQIKAYNKLYSRLANGVVNSDGIATFYAYKLPNDTFSVMLKRV